MGGEGSGRRPDPVKKLMGAVNQPYEQPSPDSFVMPNYSGIKEGVKKTDSSTKGAVLFYGDSAIASDPSNFFWDDTNNRLGIGTDSPLANLEVNGDSADIYIRQANDYYSAILGSASDGEGFLRLFNDSSDGSSGDRKINLQANGDSYIDNSANFGIGTATPEGTLHVASSDKAKIYLQDTGISTPFTDIFTSGIVGTYTQAYTSNGGIAAQGFSNNAAKEGFIFQGHVGSNSPTVNAIQFQGWKLDAGGTDRTAMTGTEKIVGFSAGDGTSLMTIQANGNVGIGTTAPDAPLEVAGDVHISNSGDLIIGSTTLTEAQLISLLALLE